MPEEEPSHGVLRTTAAQYGVEIPRVCRGFAAQVEERTLAPTRRLFRCTLDGTMDDIVIVMRPELIAYLS